jgi:hypothetical protein
MDVAADRREIVRSAGNKRAENESGKQNNYCRKSFPHCSHLRF